MKVNKTVKCFFAVFFVLVIILSVSCAPAKYDLFTSVNPANGGMVTPAGGAYEIGSVLNVTAQPLAGYHFDHWSGNATGTSNPLSVIMNGSKNIIANFRVGYSLNIIVSPANGGTVMPAGGAYDEGAQIQLTATAADGYRFDGWTGGTTGKANPITVTMSGDKTITANFVAVYNLSVLVSPNNGGTVTPAIGIYDEGTQVELTATPAPGYRFLNWSGDATGTNNHLTLSMDYNKSITANFVAQFILAVSVTPVGAGTVTAVNGTYDDGTILTITTNASLGFAFDHWSGDAAGTSDSITIAVDDDKNIVAHFIRTLALGVGKIDDAPYIKVIFPDGTDGIDKIFYLPTQFTSSVSEFTEIITTTDPVSGEVLEQRICNNFGFTWIPYEVGSRIASFFWRLTVINYVTGDRWYHEGQFHKIVLNAAGDEIISFDAVIDGEVYTYPG